MIVSSRWLRLSSIVPVLFGAFLAGCDIAPNSNLSQTPLNSGGGGTVLDPAKAENITAYFYAGHPVEGLVFSCNESGKVSITGTTQPDGRFVCPRTSTASFFLGIAASGTLKLGEVKLEIFGHAEDTALRNDVAITPATLYGTATDGDRREVANIFNLLVSLDTTAGRSGSYRPTIYLGPTMLAALLESPDFAKLDLTLPPATFASDLEALVTDLTDRTDVTLVMSVTRPSAPVLSGTEAVNYADAAISRAREGVYRTNTIVYDLSADSGYFLTSSLMVGGDGKTRGFAVTQTTSSAGAQHAEFMTLGPSAQVFVDGTLAAFSFSNGGADTLSFMGSFINDAVTGAGRLCDPDSPNHLVPEAYCNATEVNDGFSVTDSGKFSSTLGFDGDLYLARASEFLPDIDFVGLPDGFLPRTYEMSLARYTDIQQAELNDTQYLEVTADKSVFGPVSPLPQALRYTIMPNGDIVSDVDGDCSPVSLVNGDYWDSDSAEMLIGKVAKVFTVKTTGEIPVSETYLTLQIAVLDPAHPYFGLSVGIAGLGRDVFPMVLRSSDEKLLSKKSCEGSTFPCDTIKVEWFNDVVYYRDVSTKDISNGDVPVEDAAMYKDEPYYGQVTDNVPVHGFTAICR